MPRTPPPAPSGGPPDIHLLTVEQLAAALSCNISWIYDEVEAGHFPVVRLGRRLRFRPTEVDRYLQAHTTGPTHPEPAGNTLARLHAHPKRLPRR